MEGGGRREDRTRPEGRNLLQRLIKPPGIRCKSFYTSDLLSPTINALIQHDMYSAHLHLCFQSPFHVTLQLTSVSVSYFFITPSCFSDSKMFTFHSHKKGKKEGGGEVNDCPFACTGNHFAAYAKTQISLQW